jgi:hypothetical protein
MPRSDEAPASSVISLQALACILKVQKNHMLLPRCARSK